MFGGAVVDRVVVNGVALVVVSVGTGDFLVIVTVVI